MQESLFRQFHGPLAKANTLAVLQGTFDTSAIQPAHMQRSLEFCRFSPQLRETLPASIPLEEHIAFWKKMKEKKSSEPHGLHNGHFKAALDSPILTKCDHWLRDIPYMTGMSPALYQHLLDYEIEKQPGVHRIDKMRTIELMNSELNTDNKCLARAAMWNAEDLGLFVPGQAGGWA